MNPISILFALFPVRGSRTNRGCRSRSGFGSSECLETRIVLAVPSPVTGLQMTVLAPPAGSIPAEVQISWDADGTAAEYDYWISYGRRGAIATGTVETNSVDTSQLSDMNGTDGLFRFFVPGFAYQVWVRGINGDGAGPWGSGQSLIVDGGQVPASFEISSSERAEYLRFGGWDIDAIDLTAERHNIQSVDYWIERNGERLVVSNYVTGRGTDDRPSNNIAENLFEVFPTTEQDPGIYEIWVRARNGVGVSAWTGPFLRAIGQEQPQVTGPTSSSGSARPEITWSGGDPSVPFQIWIQRDGGPVVINERGISGTSYTPTVDLDPGLYRVWVRQVNESGAAMPWSNRYLVEVGTQTLPQRPVLNSDYLSNGAEPEIFWGADPLAVRWEVSITLRGNGQEVLRESTLTGTSWRSAEPLQVRVEYRIWLRAIGPTGVASRWSVPVDAIFENNLISYRTRN